MDSTDPNPPVSEPPSGLEASAAAHRGSPAEPAVTEAAPTTSFGLRPYDFRRPALLSSNESRKLRAQYEEFLDRLSARLTNYLRLETEVKLHSIETFSFHEFTGALMAPTHLTLFKIEPLRGICVI